MPTDKQKLLVIGLDGATFDVLLPLVEQGLMPHLAALMERGCWGRLTSTIPPFTAAAWSTFATGQNPGQHGVLSFRHQRDRFNYDLQGGGFVDARRFERTLWEVLGAAGQQVGIVNVPLTYPARPVNGYMVTGMLTPLGAEQFTYPPEFAAKLGQDYVIDVDFVRDEEGFRVRGFPPKGEMIAQIRHMSRTRARACARLLQDEPWDFFMVVFTSTDRVMHFFWDDLEGLTAGSPEGDAAIRQEVTAYFRELDAGIGQLVGTAGPSARVLVISDHGFGPAQTRRFYANVWLEKLGLLRPRGASGVFDLEYWRTVIGRNKHLKALLRRLLPASTQDKATATARSASKDILDWSQTRAYFVPIYFHVCGIEINLAGARREGIVQPGAEYEALRDRIIQEAQALRDPQSNTPIVELAARREDLYRGPCVENFPDVILVLNPNYIGVPSVAGSSLAEPHDPTRPGEHRQDGIFVAAGPAIQPARDLPGLNLIDIPPTALYALGVAVPTSFDGRVIQEAFDPAYLQANPIQTQEPAPASPGEAQRPPGYSQDEETEIEERLRGLGYIE